MRNRDNEIFKTSLELITKRMKDILDLLDNTITVGKNSNKCNSLNVLELKNELSSITNNIIKIFIESDLDEIRLTKFSMVVYDKVMNIVEYLKSNIKYGVLVDGTSIKILNLDDNQMNRVYNSIKALQLCIDKVSE